MRLFEPLLLVYVLLACSCSNTDDTKTEPEREAVRIAQQYVSERYPSFDTVNNHPIVHDKDGTWEVEYRLPRGVFGGTPVVVIEKKGMTVLRSFHTQ